MKRSLPLAFLIIGTMAGAVSARGFGGGIAGAPVGNGIMGTGGLWGDSIMGAGGMWADGAYGAGLPWGEFMPGTGDAYGGFFSGPPQDNLASKAPAHYNPLGGEQAISAPPQQ